MDPVQPDLVQTQSEDSSFNKILKIILVILFILSIGIGGFILFRLNNKKEPSSVVPTSTISPTVTVKSGETVISPTVSVSNNVETDNPENIDIGSVEADLKDIGTDVNSLQ